MEVWGEQYPHHLHYDREKILERRGKITIKQILWHENVNEKNTTMIARPLSTKDSVGSLTSTDECRQTGRLFNVHPREGTHIDEWPHRRNTEMTAYRWVGIQSQARQHRGKCVHLKAILSARQSNS